MKLNSARTNSTPCRTNFTFSSTLGRDPDAFHVSRFGIRDRFSDLVLHWHWTINSVVHWQRVTVLPTRLYMPQIYSHALVEKNNASPILYLALNPTSPTEKTRDIAYLVNFTGLALRTSELLPPGQQCGSEQLLLAATGRDFGGKHRDW